MAPVVIPNEVVPRRRGGQDLLEPLGKDGERAGFGPGWNHRKCEFVQTSLRHDWEFATDSLQITHLIVLISGQSDFWWRQPSRLAGVMRCVLRVK